MDDNNSVHSDKPYDEAIEVSGDEASTPASSKRGLGGSRSPSRSPGGGDRGPGKTGYYRGPGKTG
jgi:hypothetical protein